MTNNEAIEILHGLQDGYYPRYSEALEVGINAIKALEQKPCKDATLKDIFCMGCEYKEQEPCDDCISRQAVLDQTYSWSKDEFLRVTNPFDYLRKRINSLPSVTPKEKTGEWLRMSDLSEQEDDRYKCSYCGNVVHHRDKMNLYTFNSWCGRCGSDNGRK